MDKIYVTLTLICICKHIKIEIFSIKLLTTVLYKLGLFEGEILYKLQLVQPILYKLQLVQALCMSCNLYKISTCT